MDFINPDRIFTQSPLDSCMSFVGGADGYINEGFGLTSKDNTV